MSDDFVSHYLVVSHHCVNPLEVEQLLVKFGDAKNVFPFQKMTKEGFDLFLDSEMTAGNRKDAYARLGWLNNDDLQEPIYVYDLTDHKEEIEKLSFLEGETTNPNENYLRLIALIQRDDDEKVHYEMIEAVSVRKKSEQ